MIVYIAGPMRGIPYYNFPAFDRARDYWQVRAYEVLSPADMDREEGFDPTTLPEDTDWKLVPENFSFYDCVERDIEAVKKCDMVFMLGGWETSSGAKAERELARWLGKEIRYEDFTKDEEANLYVMDRYREGSLKKILDRIPPKQRMPLVSEEIRTKDDSTGAEKGMKKARMDLIPTQPLWELAEHYGQGSSKYADRNWEKGYDWSKTYAAAMRHLIQFWHGEDIDPETGSKHVIAAAWHCLALAEYMETHKEKDNRP